ncbi:ribonuclease H-like domain-containing protein [Tanacetum coccineum]
MKCSLNVQFIYSPTSGKWQYTVCKYATEILERANMVGCNSSRTPVDTESELGDDGDPVCLYMDDPREPHFSALKRILRYVRGTLDHGLQLFSSSTTSLVSYSDAD